VEVATHWPASNFGGAAPFQKPTFTASYAYVLTLALLRELVLLSMAPLPEILARSSLFGMVSTPFAALTKALAGLTMFGEVFTP
jgi:hypothetical protein